MEEKKIKVLLVNGSPRLRYNTGKALRAAMEGAVEAGAEAELINLYQTKNLKGCYSCFQCQRKGFDKTDPVCCIKDETWPLLEKAREADVVILGSPVYFGYPTGEFRSFCERFMFPKFSYLSTAELVNPKQTACIFTMNCPKEYMDGMRYETLLGQSAESGKKIYGYGEALYICNTYQFDDYSAMAFDYFSEEEKRAYRDAHFQEDLDNAKALGKRLVEQARKTKE